MDRANLNISWLLKAFMNMSIGDNHGISGVFVPDRIVNDNYGTSEMLVPELINGSRGMKKRVIARKNDEAICVLQELEQ